MTQAIVGPEAALSQQALTALQKHFEIKQEHWGTHPTGKRLRIDAIAVPRIKDGWSRSDIAFGIEFKAPCVDRNAERRDRKANAKIISQCIDYSLVDWDGIGCVPIFFCPGFAEINSLRERDDVFDFEPQNYQTGFAHGIGFLMAAILGQNNVGELVQSNHLGWAFLINGKHRLWSERYGVGEAKINKLVRRVGSR